VEGRPPPFLGAGAVHREVLPIGDLGPEDAPDLFDELLPQARPGSVYALTQLLTAVTRAPVSSTMRDGPALAVSLCNRMARAGTKKVAPDAATYTILISCCCQAGCLNLGFAALGQIIKTGLRADAVIFTPCSGPSVLRRGRVMQ